MDEFINALSIKDPETGEWKGIAALRGEKGDAGDTGPQGPKGDTGTFDYVSATVTNTTGTPAVNVDYDGANATFHFSGIKGETGAKGDTGNTGPQGPKGDTGSTGPQGAAGQDGADGYSPAVTITEITGGHSVTITDAEHPDGQTFNVMDGEDATNPVESVNGMTGDVQLHGGNIPKVNGSTETIADELSQLSAEKVNLTDTITNAQIDALFN